MSGCGGGGGGVAADDLRGGGGGACPSLWIRVLLVIVERLLIGLDCIRIVVEGGLSFQCLGCDEMCLGAGKVGEDGQPSVIFESKTTGGAEPFVHCFDRPAISEATPGLS